MRCPSCGYMNKRGQVRCKKCGVKMKRKCFNCGVENSGDAKFCKDCGRPLAGKFAKTEKSFLCSNCQSPINEGSNVCTRCGAKIEWDKLIVEEG